MSLARMCGGMSNLPITAGHMLSLCGLTGYTASQDHDLEETFISQS